MPPRPQRLTFGPCTARSPTAPSRPLAGLAPLLPPLRPSPCPQLYPAPPSLSPSPREWDCPPRPRSGLPSPPPCLTEAHRALRLGKRFQLKGATVSRAPGPQRTQPCSHKSPGLCDRTPPTGDPRPIPAGSGQTSPAPTPLGSVWGGPRGREACRPDQGRHKVGLQARARHSPGCHLPCNLPSPGSFLKTQEICVQTSIKEKLARKVVAFRCNESPQNSFTKIRHKYRWCGQKWSRHTAAE